MIIEEAHITHSSMRKMASSKKASRETKSRRDILGSDQAGVPNFKGKYSKMKD